MIQAIVNYIQQNPVEVFAALTGLWSIWLNTRANPWGWVIGMLSILPYLYIFFESKLYQDFLLHIFYLVMAFYGLWSWIYARDTEGNALQISTAPPNRLRIALGFGGLGTLLSGAFFDYFTDTDVAYWDAFTTAFSFVGTWLLAKKYRENWLVWLVVNTVAVGIYSYKGLYITVGLYGLYIGLAFLGWQKWGKASLNR